MGLTKRKESYYVEFPVLDGGKVLTLARGAPGARLKRWKVGNTNRTIAKQQEALIKTALMKGEIKSERLPSLMTFRAWGRSIWRFQRSRPWLPTGTTSKRSICWLGPFF